MGIVGCNQQINMNSHNNQKLHLNFNPIRFHTHTQTSKIFFMSQIYSTICIYKYSLF